MIYLVGASHLMAILDACRASDDQGHGFGNGQPPAFRDWPLRDGMLPDALRVASVHVGHIAPHWGPVLAELLPEGRLGIAPGFQALLATAAMDTEAQALFISMRGEEYFHLGTASVHEPFDFVLPERPDLVPVPSRALLPLALVQQHLAQSLSRTLLALTAVRRLCPALRLVRIVPPPPTSSEDVVRWTAERGPDTHPTERLPSALRLKLWLLYTRLLDEGTAALGMEVLPVPPTALHPGGLLRREYMEDALHGNARYGALVCEQMAAVVAPALEGAR